MSLVLVTLLIILSLLICEGSLFLGTEPIENAALMDAREDQLLIVVETDCVGLDPDYRGSMVNQLFGCLSYSSAVMGPTLSGLLFDCMDESCMDDPTINLRGYDLCLHGVTYDVIGSFQTCTNRSTLASDLKGPVSSWAVDSMDGSYDGTFSYYDNPKSADLYIFDTGVRDTHQEFSSRVEHLATYAGVPYFPPNFSPAYHGTSVASLAGGDDYGSSGGQTIYNVNIAETSGSALFPSLTFVLQGLSDAFDNMIATGRRGVINMSFSLNVFGAQLELFEDLLQQINDFGSVVVASAGNGGSTFCAYPAGSDKTISVGAYTESLDLAFFSTYGTCVDAYAPGYRAYAADVASDTSYRSTAGTSFASPYIVGIVANYIAECEYTGYDDLCELDVIKQRLQGPPSTKLTHSTKCNDPECNGIVYDCQDPFYPRPVEPCSGGNCSLSEAGKCQVYNNNACSQCANGYFKISDSYPCVSCSETFGDRCLFCNDAVGCAQCESNNFELVVDGDSGLQYCEPTPCLNEENNCKVCNNGLCSQCKSGFVMNPDQKSCSSSTM